MLPSPYGTCVKDVKGDTKSKDVEQQLKYLGGDYTKSKCLLECETDFIVDNCSCRTYYMPGSSPFCSPRDLIECFYTKRDEFNGIKNTVCHHCEESCQQTVYSTTASQSTFPSYSVATTMLSSWRLSDREYFKMALKEKIMGTAFMDFVIASMSRSFSLLLGNAINKEGERLHESYPRWLYSTDDLQNTFLSMQYDLFLELATYATKQVQDEKMNGVKFNSTSYIGTLSKTYMEWYGKQFKLRFGESLKHEYHSKAQNVSFVQFVDNVYEEYNIESVFNNTFQEVSQITYEMLLTTGRKIIESTDLRSLITQYLRDNMVHVEIFFGDLKVEEIKEQTEYELFQFICDWGGALGLFFGASLQSFIEIIDFFCRRLCQKKNIKKPKGP
ncbi:uncharacterized protein [Amphiura filiformis]|uniref:uncharacterized protein n=1 Tax=Amphiura filiformis TaxID=82378 RepID=UPI003B218DF1